MTPWLPHEETGFKRKGNPNSSTIFECDSIISESDFINIEFGVKILFLEQISKDLYLFNNISAVRSSK